MKSAVSVFYVKDNLILGVSRKNNHTLMGLPGGGVEEFDADLLDAQVLIVRPI